MNTGFLLLMLSLPNSAADETPFVAARDRAVDVLLTAEGRRLTGLSFSESARGTYRFLMRTETLQQADPTLAEYLLAIPAADSPPDDDWPTVVEQYIQELEDGDAAPELVGAWSDYHRRLQPDVPETAPTYIDATLPRRLVRRLIRQQDRRLGELAILNGSPGVEERHRNDVAAELQASAAAGHVLWAEVSPEGNQSLDPAQRLRQIEAAIDLQQAQVNRLIAFQGQFFQDAPNRQEWPRLMAQLLPSMFTQPLFELLRDPSDRSARIQSRAETTVVRTLPPTAELLLASNSRNTTLVTAMSLDLNSATVTLSGSLFTRNENTTSPRWDFQTSTTVRVSSDEVPDERIAELQNHPQLQGLLTAFQSAGSQQGHLRKALATGAAVEIAQRRLQDQWFDLAGRVLSAGQAEHTVHRVIVNHPETWPAP